MSSSRSMAHDSIPEVRTGSMRAHLHPTKYLSFDRALETRQVRLLVMLCVLIAIRKWRLLRQAAQRVSMLQGRSVALR